MNAFMTSYSWAVTKVDFKNRVVSIVAKEHENPNSSYFVILAIETHN